MMWLLGEKETTKQNKKKLQHNNNNKKNDILDSILVDTISRKNLNKYHPFL